MYLTTKPDRVGAGYAILEQELRVHACIRVHTGKTKIWNQAGVRPEVCDVLEGIPFEEQGIKVLGSPVGHPAFVARQLERGRPECDHPQQQVLQKRMIEVCGIASRTF